jgi:hypothetical protein
MKATDRSIVQGGPPIQLKTAKVIPVSGMGRRDAAIAAWRCTAPPEQNGVGAQPKTFSVRLTPPKKETGVTVQRTFLC